MLDFAQKYYEKGHSQNGEWGVIKEILCRLDYKSSLKENYLAVEFGAADGIWCSNTVDIALNYRGWKRLLYDINPSGLDVMKAGITPENVNSLVPDCNVLSIDTDGNDYNIWMAYKGKPDIVIVEINSSFAPTVEHTTKEQGASYRTMCKLALSKHYFVVCHTGNLICVHNRHMRLFPEMNEVDPVENWSLFFNTSWLR